MIKEIRESLNVLSVPSKALSYPYFFKTGIGEYGEGDQFIGTSVPDQRKIAKEFYQVISLDNLRKLLSSKIHEHRHCALLVLVAKFEKASEKNHKDIVDFYLNNLKQINNWDLVDTSCYKILGRYCFKNKTSEILLNLADSEGLWHKRIAIVSTLYFIKKNDLDLTKILVLKNLEYPHHLMHRQMVGCCESWEKKAKQNCSSF